MTATLHDQPARYGVVTRLLHWSMAILLVWQFAGMAIKLIVGRAPITAFWVGTHVSVGALLMLLIVVRLLWTLSQYHARPRHQPGFWGRAARVGHITLYALMLVVPLLALLRQIGSGRDFVLFGISVLSGSGSPTEWMTRPANMFHRPLAWTLLALIVGHIGMVVIHRYFWRDEITSRMTGSPPTKQSARA